MILKNSVLVLVLCTVWQNGIEAISYSKVYVQQGSNLAPVDYVNYGSPPSPVQIDGNQVAQIAQLSAAPFGSEVPLTQVTNFAPCVTPCVVKNPTISPITNARLAAYKVPVVLAKAKEDPVSYEYSYVVYDENTGDQKAQRELSDGGVVTGEYSFMQPDGYVREVKYTADDVKGFNAVVKKFLPPDDGDKKSYVETTNNPPCDPVKSEALQEKPQSDAPKVTDVPPNAEVAKVEEVFKDVGPSTEEQKFDTTTLISTETTTITLLDDTISKQDTTTTPAQTTTNEAVEIVTPVNEKKPTELESMTDPTQNLSWIGDILKCLQAAAISNGGQNSVSPLTYILLPSKNCVS